MNDIRKIRTHGHQLWQRWGRVEPASYIYHSLKARGMSPQRANRIMAELLPTLMAAVEVPATTLLHKGKVIGYRLATNVGPRYARPREATAFLRRDGYTTAEIDSLFQLARRERVKRGEVCHLLARGIKV
jgi:hypothetical protein